MIRRLTSALLPFALVAGAAACGGGGGGGSAGDTLQQSIEEDCQKAHECMDTFDPVAAGFEFDMVYQSSVDECITFFGMLFDDPGAVDDAVDAETVIFNEDDAQECLDFFGGLSCEEYWEADAPAACATAYEGTIANGDACEISLECEAGFCEEMVCTAG